MAVHAFIFPGQGSQAVGMGRDLAAAFAAARAVFEEVDEVLKQKLSKLMFEGPIEELTLTENAQPALMAVSLAVLRVLESEGGITLKEKAVLVAGHSLGEYSALAAAQSFSIADTARLLKLARPVHADAPCRQGAAPWRPCWALSWNWRARSAWKPKKVPMAATSSPAPMIMAAARW